MTPVIIEKLPGLALAAEAVGSYHHQVMGTVVGNICQQNRCKYFNQSQWWRSSRPTCYKAGGEICHVVNKKETCYASYCGDIAPVLLVLNARILVMGPQGKKEINLEDLFSGDGKAPLNLSPGDIVTEVIIPAPDMNAASGYSKFANRESIDFPILGAAFWAAPGNRQYRLAFTAVERKPVRALQVEAFLDGKELNQKNIAAAGELAATAAKPVKNSVYSPSYKRRMMGLLLKEAAFQAMGRNSA
jgi:4-hydroxybenzoyl-CoA reductase subunit beta